MEAVANPSPVARIRLPPGLEERFQPLEVLGEGAFGMVLRAHQVSLERNVVLKVLKTRAGTQVVDRARFRQEAQLLAGSAHPNILEILDYEIHPEFSFMVYPDNQGVPLTEIAPRGSQMPWPDLVEVLGDCLRGLAFLHRGGIVHRDLKPANILRKEDGNWILIDLGLAREERRGAGLTATGHTPGTPLYMSPQLLRGEVPAPSDDLYALGALAYELSTGSPPFQGQTLSECLENHLLRIPPPLQEVLVDFPTPLSGLVEALLSKSPEERPGSCEEALSLLEAVPRKPAPPPRPPGHSRRPPASPLPPETGAGWPPPLGLLVALALSGSLALGLLWPGPARDEPPPAPLPTPDLGRRIEQVEAELLRSGPELPRDPGHWPRALEQLPVLASLRQEVLSQSPAELTAPEREALARLGSRFAALQLPAPFPGIRELLPASSPRSLVDPLLRRFHPPEQRDLVFPRWAGTALETLATGFGRIQLLRGELRRIQRGQPPVRPMPPRLASLLGTDLRAASLEQVVHHSWTRSRASREDLGAWMAEEGALLPTLSYACQRALVEEDLPPEQFLPVALTWQDLLAPLGHGASALLPPPELSRQAPPSAEAALHLLQGAIRARQMRARLQITSLDPDPIPALFEHLTLPPGTGEEGSRLVGTSLLLLARWAREFARPELLVRGLEASRNALLSSSPFPTNSLETVGAVLQVLLLPGDPLRARFRDELARYPAPVRASFPSSGPTLVTAESLERAIRGPRRSTRRNPNQVIQDELVNLLSPPPPHPREGPPPR